MQRESYPHELVINLDKDLDDHAYLSYLEGQEQTILRL